MKTFNKLALAASLLCAAGALQAQSSVTVYGLLDVGVMAQTNAANLNTSTWGNSGSPINYPGVKNGNVFGFMTGGESQSRLGFKGSEDLGGGTKTFFLLEQGFNAATGAVASNGMAGNGANTSASQGGDNALQGLLFGRGAYAGIGNEQYGTLTLGRQQGLMLQNIGSYNPVNAQMFSPIAFSGTYGGGGYTDNAYVSGAIQYTKKYNGFNLKAMYAPGGVAGNNSAGTTSGFQLGYEEAKWGVQAIATHTTDATKLSGVTYGTTISTANGAVVPGNASPASSTSAASTIPTTAGTNQLLVTLANTSALQLTSKFQATDQLNLKAGYERMFIGTPSNFQMYSGLPVLPSGFSIASWTPNRNNYNINVYWVGANYSFTESLIGSIGYYYAGTQQSGTQLSGVQQFQSAMLDYYMSKRTNLYLGIGNVNTSGSNVQPLPAGSMLSGKTVSTQQTFGMGMRHTF
jgi:predicted porin